MNFKFADESCCWGVTLYRKFRFRGGLIASFNQIEKKKLEKQKKQEKLDSIHQSAFTRKITKKKKKKNAIENLQTILVI